MTANTRTLRLTAIFLAGAVTGGLPGCKQEAASTPAPPIPEVQVITVTTQSVPDEPEFIGQTESSRPVEIRSQVTGIIKEWSFQEGRDVKKGARLYQIDPVPFQAALLSAKAKVAQAGARLVQAEQNLARVKPLLAEQAVSQKDVDDAVAEELAAKAALEAAKGDLVKAKFDFDNTLITAPIDGMIERTRVYEGRLVAAQSDLLTIVHQVDPMYVTVSAPETFLLKRQRDIIAKKIQHPGVYQLRGTIIFLDGTTYPHEGTLDLLDVGMRTETGSRPARVTFPNPERLLVPGQFVTVRFKGTVKTEAILVPQRAVQQGPKGPVLYVVANGDKVEIRDVQATSWQGNQWLIEEGLHAGEQVVVGGFQRIMPGVPVKPVPYTEAETAPVSQPTDTKREQTK
ncbi:MAG: efflux transporter periplasmic adaptor subunit [Nitrospirae bacterium 13_1_40CM_2_62_10]|nr:MAG: efflux transporter periplasmic adaptor subunit [Nitrospirae bacterium 13_1_40CM_2_62_10]